MIIDAHAHMWGRDLGDQSTDKQPAYLSTALENIGISFDGQVEFFISMMERAGVDKVLIYAVNNDSVADMVRPHKDRFIPFAKINLKKPEELEYCVNSLGFKGVAELSPAGRHFYIDDFDLLDPLYRKAIDLDVPISWHLKDSFIFGGSRSVFTGNQRLQEVCFKHPQLKHIICHLGNPDSYMLTLSAFAGYPNVYFDLSGIATSILSRYMVPRWGEGGRSRLTSYLYPDKVTDPPSDYKEIFSKVKSSAINVLREASNIAQEKIMFGTDSPLSGREEFELEICKEAFGHDKELLQHVMGENARKLLRL